MKFSKSHPAFLTGLGILIPSVQRGLFTGARQTSRLLFWLVLVNALFVCALFILLFRLARLKNLVTMCAWSRTVEFEGEWLSFEEYLARRFQIRTSHGISPGEVEKAMEKLARKDGD